MFECQVKNKRVRKLSVDCKNCGKKFNPQNKKTKFCSTKCFNFSQRRVERPTKKEITNLLSKNSFVAVGKMFSVSDNTIRKWLK